MFRILSRNYLIIKHILQTCEDTLWKSFLSVILSILLGNLRNITTMDSEDDANLWHNFYSLLYRSMEHWKYKHFVFALNSGLSKLIKEAYSSWKDPSRYKSLRTLILLTKLSSTKYGNKVYTYVRKELKDKRSGKDQI